MTDTNIQNNLRARPPFSSLTDATFDSLMRTVLTVSTTNQTVENNVMDRLLSCSPAFLTRLSTDSNLLSRLCLISKSRPFRNLPTEKMEVAMDNMSQRKVVAGETVLTQGEKFDYFYLLESGTAEVWRTDPMTDETACVDTIGAGETFGEEALVMNGFRNATIKMLTPGLLWRLDQNSFNNLLRDALVEEVSPEEAKLLADKGDAIWLDCRYDMEFEEAHIPGAKWVPLDTIRKHMTELDPAHQYIIYCRSGRRSASATFLMRERGFKALSMAGGIKAWPFETQSLES